MAIFLFQAANELPRDKTNKMACAPSERSAWASAQSDQSSLCAQWPAKDPSFLHADTEDWVDAQADLRLHWSLHYFVGFVGGSNVFITTEPFLLQKVRRNVLNILEGVLQVQSI